ncbi:unnamed protein product [Leuciscus chuanchicus]
MKFLNFQDVVRVMRAARQKGRVMYGDQEIKFFPDLSAEVLRQRRRFDDIKQRLRSLNLRYGIVYPAKLRVTVNGQTHEFEDPSDAEKFLQGIQSTGVLWIYLEEGAGGGAANGVVSLFAGKLRWL